jgi:hypothetical protein
MPQNHYAIGGTMAVYNVIGRMKVYEVTGKPFGNDFVPRHREGSGSISGVGSLTADYIFGGVGGIVGEGSPAASAMSVRSGDSSVVGAGSPVAYGGKSNSFDGTIIGVGDPQASGTEGEAFYSAELDSVGSLAASGTTTRNSVGATATGDGSPVAEGSGILNFYQMIQAIGADANLDFCLDAASIDSYIGSGQSWLDLSGNGNNFYRGATVNAEASDPTFNGIAGDLSSAEYFGLDGGDHFNETAAHTFAETWHKNNGAFTIAGIAQKPTGSTFSPIFSNNNGFNTNGTYTSLTTSGSSNLTLQLFIISGGFSALNLTQSMGDLAGSVVFFAISIDESVGANGLTFQANATRFKATSTYASTGTNASAYSYKVGGTQGASSANGTRFYCTAGWSRRLSDTELDDLYEKLKVRYTTLP